MFSVLTDLTLRFLQRPVFSNAKTIRGEATQRLKVKQLV